MSAPWPDPNHWPTDGEFVAMVRSVPSDFPLCDCGTQDGTSVATNPASRADVLAHHFDCSAVTAWAAVRDWATAQQRRFRVAAELVVQDMRAQRGDSIAAFVEDAYLAHFDRAEALSAEAAR